VHCLYTSLRYTSLKKNKVCLQLNIIYYFFVPYFHILFIFEPFIRNFNAISHLIRHTLFSMDAAKNNANLWTEWAWLFWGLRRTKALSTFPWLFLFSKAVCMCVFMCVWQRKSRGKFCSAEEWEWGKCGARWLFSASTAKLKLCNATPPFPVCVCAL